MSALRQAAFPPVPIPREEALRYAMQPRRREAPPLPQFEECLAMAEGRVTCRALWREYPLSHAPGGVDLGFAVTDSAALARHLEGCGGVILFAATAGVEMDRLILRAKARSPLHGLLMHAIGAAIIEEACDRLCALLAEEHPGRALRSRFSPGYGDLPLDLQRPVFAALDCTRRLGLTLTDSLLMAPSKSVTGIVGMEGGNGPQPE